MYTILFYLFTCVAPICTVHMSVSTDNEPIDLGFNGDIEDKCDYLDYLEIDLDIDHDQWELTVMQLNIRGLLNKQEDLKHLLTKIKKKPRMCIIHSSSFPGLSMQLQVGLISCAAVTRGKKPLPLLVEYIESR